MRKFVVAAMLTVAGSVAVPAMAQPAPEPTESPAPTPTGSPVPAPTDAPAPAQ